MDSPVSSVLDFSSFVKELNQSPLADYAISANSSRNCCAADSQLSKTFESAMQKLITNYDSTASSVVASERGSGCLPDPCDTGHTPKDSASCSDKEIQNESLATTVDFDEPLELELTSEEFDDSGDAGDEGSSDEQQHSRSLSLSYSLSISHAHENFSQYSQSTDKGLSKRYDSPCSYDDDRESECSNFDKLDDWNDFISDMQNNNGTDATNRDFKEYYDEYVANKGQVGTASDGIVINDQGTSNGSDTKEITSTCGEHKRMADSAVKTIDAAEQLTPSSSEKYRTFLEYRNPTNETDDDLMGLEDNVAGLSVEHCSSFKRKFCYEDCDDCEYEMTSLSTEKFHKADVVPDRGSHKPISLIDDAQFARLTQVESPSKTPIPRRHVTSEAYCEESSVEEGIDFGETALNEEETTIATTPTNPRAFRNVTNDINANQRQYDGGNNNRRRRKKAPIAVSAIQSNIDLQLSNPNSTQQRGNFNQSLTQKVDSQYDVL